MDALRMAVAGLAATVVTGALFLLMQYLISTQVDGANRQPSSGSIRFGPVEVDDELSIKQRRIPEPPPPPSASPPLPTFPLAEVPATRLPTPSLNMPMLDVPSIGMAPTLGEIIVPGSAIEGDAIPLIRVSARYPDRALRQGIEGYVTIEFTITAKGAVADAVVVDAQPPQVFNRDAIQALQRWKFKPRVVNGTAVSRRATQTLDFKLDGR